MIAYREVRPCPALAQHVECYWVMAGAPGPDAPIERILPDGCVELILHLDEPFRAFSEDARSQPQPSAFVVGPSTRFLLIQPPRRLTSLGVRFRPAGARLLLPMPLHEIAEGTTTLDDLIGSGARGIRESVGNASDDAARVRALEAELLRQLARTRNGGTPLRPVIRETLESRGQVRVREVARRSGLSPRQLERRFLDEVGLSPKSLLRLVRFQAVLDAIGRRQAVEWADVATDCGYSDQAHLIREFRAFSGETPLTLRRAQGPLSRQFTSPQRLRAFFEQD